MNALIKNIIGQTFGRLTVVQRSHSDPWGRVIWHCRCSCGNYVDVLGTSLRAGKSTSCGCRKNELSADRMAKQFTTHGHTKGKTASREFETWRNMIQRCTNPKHDAYKNYGGRGIKVCDRWLKFENFLADMGRAPSPDHSLDRFPNNDGNYEPGNCRWATRKQQANNRRSRS